MNRTKILTASGLAIFVLVTAYTVNILLQPEGVVDSFSGTVAFKNKSVLPAGTSMQVEIIDLSSKSVISEITKDVSNISPPLDYKITYPKSKIDKNGQYGLRVSITNGDEILLHLEKPQTIITYGEIVANTNIVVEPPKQNKPPAQCEQDTFVCDSGEIVNRVPPSCDFAICQDISTTSSSSDDAEDTDASTKDFSSTNWTWQQTIYTNGVLEANNEYILSFGDENDSFTVTTDCNNISGNITVSGSSISAENTRMTEMFCEGSLDSKFASDFGTMQTYEISGSQLTITLSNGSEMIFTESI